jgi:hypothetical protein
MQKLQNKSATKTPQVFPHKITLCSCRSKDVRVEEPGLCSDLLVSVLQHLSGGGVTPPNPAVHAQVHTQERTHLWLITSLVHNRA